MESDVDLPKLRVLMYAKVPYSTRQIFGFISSQTGAGDKTENCSKVVTIDSPHALHPEQPPRSMSDLYAEAYYARHPEQRRVTPSGR